MKISELKNNKMVRWICCAAICYLLASWGVNGTVNPVNYWNQGEKDLLSTEWADEYLRIDVKEQLQKGGYINLNISEMNSFMISINVVTGSSELENQKQTLRLSKGMNSWTISELNAEEGWIKIPLKTLEKEQVQINQIYWSECKQVDGTAMLKVFSSFICLLVFYSFVSWIKGRYSL